MQITNQQIVPANLNVGDRFSLTQYYKVTGKQKDSNDTRIVSENENGDTHFISSDIVAKNAWSANQITKEIYVSREEMTHIIQLIGSEIFTVVYRKQMNDTEVNKALKANFLFTNELFDKAIADIETNPSDIKKIKKSLEADVKALQKESIKNIKEVVDGELRTLVGRKFTPVWNTSEDLQEFLKVSTNTGRISVIDLEQPKELAADGFDKRYRLVDLRTAEILIWRNTKIIYGKAPKV